MRVPAGKPTWILNAVLLSSALAAATDGVAAEAAAIPPPWMDQSLNADQRADRLIGAMTLDEKIQTVFGYFSTDFAPKAYVKPAQGRPYTAGFVAGVPRLGLPNQWQTDAGLGVATQAAPAPFLRGRTSLPSGLATAATWNPKLAFAGGAMIGAEARLSGHNILLAGGANLLREPRNGRNFEYAGEDPLLAGVMVGEQIRGIQSNHVMSTVKHFALNDQETNRGTIDAKIADAAARTSDLLAFEFAIERGHPAAVMCAYNRVNGVYACESDYLLNQVLKTDWAYDGYVMSDWGATHSTIPAALSGLDQQSGYPFDQSEYFNGALKEAVVDGHVPQARFDNMLHRIVRSMFANGLIDDPVVAAGVAGSIDFAADAEVARSDAEEGIVLLKNSASILPLDTNTGSIVVIGGHADTGVLSGGGSSQVYPVGGLVVPNEGPAEFPGPMVFHPSSPLRALAERSKATISYLDGKDIEQAATVAASSDIAIVFATQWTAESVDVPTLSLPGNQDALIAAVAKANPKTIVVLETGGPVTMPWLDQAAAVVEAWYPGSSGGPAIARVLTGEVNPSGHLPASFPVSAAQLPRPVLDGNAADGQTRFSIDYNIEGAAVGYKWFDLKNRAPLFPFGHGLSYTTFAYSGLQVSARDGRIAVSFKVQNTGGRDGQAVPQLYVSPAGPQKPAWEAPKRLAGWDKVGLAVGATGDVSLIVDPRLLGVYDTASKTWRIGAGEYVFTLAESAGAKPAATARLHLPARTLSISGR
jgi:beta-glucosidase